VSLRKPHPWQAVDVASVEVASVEIVETIVIQEVGDLIIVEDVVEEIITFRDSDSLTEPIQLPHDEGPESNGNRV
jgi:hypothetical protein